MRFQIHAVRFHVLPMRTRFPFQYGIASMSALPHLFAGVEVEMAGKTVTGIASEGLPPKWFTKDPATPFEADLAEMLAVIQNAARLSRLAAEKPVAYFPWWQSLYSEQKVWAGLREKPPLLANLGVSLMERAVLDALCKASQTSLHHLLGSAELDIRLGDIHPELTGLQPAQVIATAPSASVAVRHTVGLGDPLEAADIPDADKLDDGLPQALDESILAYGLRYFKIKVCGQADKDLPRLRRLTRVLEKACPRGFHSTLDGNEQFQDLNAFRDFYETLRAEPALAPLFRSLIFIEQPLHRSHALRDEVAPALAGWKDGPGLIIDESDSELSSLPRALDLGYSGTSHKNCKGIIKGLANAALLKKRATPARPLILSGEDLANVGPVALLQDLAMMAALGLKHVERNGHHYFRGLSMHPASVQQDVLTSHSDLYQAQPSGYPALNIQSGQLSLDSVHRAPFGCGLNIDLDLYEPLNDWIKRGGMSLL